MKYLSYLEEYEQCNLGKLVSSDISADFFQYIYQNYPWTSTGYSIDWTKVDNGNVIDCSSCSCEEFEKALSATFLNQYQYVCFFIYPDEPGFICSYKNAIEYIGNIIRGAGDGYMVAAYIKNGNIALYKEYFVEIHSAYQIGFSNR